MATDSSTLREACPFWSTQAMKCQLCREGLFIPLNDHISTYCQTIHYPQCRQFSLHSADHLQSFEKNRPNRRKYERVAASHRVTVAALEAEDPAVLHPPAKFPVAIGLTFDLSKGGIGIVLERPLQETAAIRFAFEDTFPRSIQAGDGRIAWCRKRKNEQYQAGIAFQDNRLIDTMGLYLGLTSIPPDAA